MSDPVVAINDTLLNVEPGQTVQTTLTVTNVGDQVEGYSVEVCKGPVHRWSQVVPRTVELLPGQHKDVAVTFRPPRWPSAPVGEFPVGVLVVSKVDSSRRAVAECDVAVGAIHGLGARLIAVSNRGRHRGRFRLDIENTGSVRTTVRITPQQPAESLSFALQPRELDIAPAATASAYLLVRPVRPTLLGQPENNPFWLSYETRESDEDSTDVPVDRPPDTGRVDGVFIRRPVMPRGLLTIIAVIAALAISAIAAARLLIPRPEPAALTQVVPTTPDLRDVRYTPEGITVSWQQVPLASGYEIQQLASGGSTDVKEVTPVEGALSTKILANLPEGEHCFRVVAVDAVGRSNPSEPKCATVVAGPAPTEKGPSGAYVLYGQQFPIADVDSYNRALSTIKDLQSQGVQAKLLDSSKTAVPAAEPTYLIYYDGFGDRSLAQKYCDLVESKVACYANDPLQ